MENKNTYWHHGYVTPADFERLHGHKGAVVWLTGLSGAGKSTIAREVEWILFDHGIRAYVLDGDNVRHGLNKDLGFSAKDREENIRRVGEVAHLFKNAGMIVIAAFISPYRHDRDNVRTRIEDGAFFEVLIQADVATCMGRDPKGLYQKAIEGKIPEFTGVSAPYEEPLSPELVLDTRTLSVKECAVRVVHKLAESGIIPREHPVVGSLASK